MKRVLWSANRFDDDLGHLFEDLEGREAELQAAVDRIVKGLLDGEIVRAPRHHVLDDTCCLPLIDRHVVVFRPDSYVERREEERVIRDFSDATRFDLLTIEEEDEFH